MCGGRAPVGIPGDQHGDVNTRLVRATSVTTAAAATVLLLLAGTARAQTLPSPTSPETSPTATASSSTGQPAGTPTQSTAPEPMSTQPAPATPSAPTSPAAAPGIRPAPSTTSTATSTRPDPAPVEAPPPADGVDPAAGQSDDYLAAAAARDDATRLVASLTASLAAGRRSLAALDDGRRTVAMETALARVAVAEAQRSADDVVRELYQQGDAGIGAFATLLAGGPEGLLDRVDTARMATSTANGVVGRADDARLRLALALQTEQAYDARLAAARAANAAIQKQLDAARVVLATADARLTALSWAPPQVAVGIDGCPLVDVPATLRDGADRFGAATLCRSAVRQAATPQAALALTWAFQHLGAVYACKGAGRMQPWRADCSSFVSRAYAEGAGLGTAGADWAPSTRNMVPWDGVALDPHYSLVAPAALRPGDLVLYDTCPQGGCPYKHVVMYLGSPDGGRTTWMLHTNACGDVAKVTAFWGFPTTGHPFLVARRVVPLPGERLRSIAPAAERRAAALATHRATAVVAALVRTG